MESKNNTEYKGYLNPKTKRWNVNIDNYFHMELVEEEGNGLWSIQREDGRYFSESEIEGGEKWKVTNCGKIRATVEYNSKENQVDKSPYYKKVYSKL